MSEDLAAWLLAQIAEDEAVARGAEPDHPGLWRRLSAESFDEHIVRWNPRRVLAECDAKRRIIAAHPPAPISPVCHECLGSIPCETVRLLALPYADRPGYREQWRP